MKVGMWQPGRHPVEIEHVFVDANEPEFAHAEIRRIVGAGRTPLVTVEPWDGTPFKWWGTALHRTETVYVRYMHEMNGTWYPWAGDPDRFRREWARWTEAMPSNVRNVLCFNVAYDGMPHALTRYFVEADVVGIDGYARNGETPAELFRPTLDAVLHRHSARPLWICETAAPRGRKQARYAEALRDFCDQQGIEACVWFNESKQGRDEADWTLTKGAARALLGRDR